MRLSWNEIRQNAHAFAHDWKDAHYEKGETQSFYNDFFKVFGVTRRRVASFEAPVRRLGDKRGFIDLFWPGVLLVEQKSAGRDLSKAKEQAFEYFPNLPEYQLPQYLLLSDFQTFELYDLDAGTEVRFALRDLPRHVQDFGFILGVRKREFRDQDPVNIQASEIMGRLHDALKASGYAGPDLERFLVRLLFCLFADDTGIFERDSFMTFLQERTREDGSDLGPWLAQVFEILDTRPERRQSSLDEDLARFPYINGDLFRERLSIPAFDSAMRALLLEACAFNWDAISPAIFGSLFQSVMDRDERRAQGAHYTTEKNILKVIRPLFLDALWEEFARLKARRGPGKAKALGDFHDRLRRMRFFDPACGCGNFLVIAYRELRLLELELLKELRHKGYLALDASVLSRVDVDQFFGIEIGEFPARIAEVALWMMDHIMNNRLSLEFGQAYARIPLVTAPHIRCADALETDWDKVLAPEDCSYVFGNPPFVGSKMQSEAQRAQVKQLAALGGSGGTLDYVAAWFLKAGAYIQRGSASIGFVATNSITQGEQAAQLWPLLFNRCGLEIAFAHRTFAWGSDARGKAHVHVVIVGLTRREAQPQAKRLFSYDDINGDPAETRHVALTPYLFDAGSLQDVHLVVREAARPLNGAPKLVIGSKPIDGGRYIFTAPEREEFLAQEPGAEAFLRPFVGAEEYLNGGKRWILALQDAEPQDLRALPLVRERIAQVRACRLKSKSKGTRALADTPTDFHVTVIPDEPFLVIPKVSSERREYVPIGWLEPPVVPSNLVRVLLGADLWHFGVLTSRMHMAWLRHIGGRLESRYRYSIGLVYNTFPWPQASKQQKERIRGLAAQVLAARAAHPGATLADLYDPDAMPNNLRRAHRDLDAAVDRLYRTAPFPTDRDRVELLFDLYEQMLAPLAAPEQPRRTRRRA
jgi:hypothetical protein